MATTEIAQPGKGELTIGFVAASLARIALGFYFFWAFIDKAFGLGYATCANAETGGIDYMCDSAWFAGGSPTTGFFTYATAGPLGEVFAPMAGSVFADVLFMVGLLGIGLALILGIGTKVGGWSAALLLFLMYLASFVPEHNPIIDDHIIYALAAVAVVYLELQRQVIGLGFWWRKLPIVQKWTWLV